MNIDKNLIDLANPLKNKMRNLIECFVEVYGEEHRADISRILHETTLVFLDELTIDQDAFATSRLKTVNELIDSSFRKFYEFTCAQAGVIPKKKTPSISFIKLKNFFEGDLEKSESLKNDMLYFYTNMFGLREGDVKTFVDNPEKFEYMKILTEDLQSAFNNKKFVGYYSLKDMIEDRERIISGNGRATPESAKLLEQASIRSNTDILSFFEQEFGNIDYSDKFVNKQCEKFNLSFLGDLFDYCENETSELKNKDEIYRTIKSIFKDSEISEKSFQDVLMGIGAQIRQNLEERYQLIDYISNNFKGVANKSLQILEKLNLSSDERYYVQKKADEFLNDYSTVPGEHLRTMTKEGKMINVCYFLSYFRLDLNTILHELNHAINTSVKWNIYKSGLFFADNTKSQNRTLNEVINEYITSKVYKSADKRGLGDLCSIAPITAAYRLFFPLLGDFIEENLEKFLEASRNADINVMYKNFGKKINALGDEIDCLYAGFHKEEGLLNAYMKLVLNQDCLAKEEDLKKITQSIEKINRLKEEIQSFCDNNSVKSNKISEKTLYEGDYLE